MGTGGVAGFASLPRSGLLEQANAADRLQLRQILVLRLNLPARCAPFGIEGKDGR
jgi:hypothetical protein